MANEITKLLQTVSLTDSEQRRGKISSKVSNPLDTGSYLVGRVLNRRRVNSEAFARTMQVAFHCVNTLEIKALAENKFLFRFDEVEDLKRILAAAPWHYDNRLLVLEKVEENQRPGDVALDHCPFYVQIHNLPFLSYLPETPRIIGGLIGKFIDADLSREGLSKDASLRLRVAIDVRQPLARVVTLETDEGEVIVANVKYEKLPMFCADCGLLDHLSKDCVAGIQQPGKQSSTVQYGLWLRVGAPKALGSSAYRRPSRTADYRSSDKSPMADTELNEGDRAIHQGSPHNELISKERVIDIPPPSKDNAMLEVPVIFAENPGGPVVPQRKISKYKKSPTSKKLPMEDVTKILNPRKEAASSSDLILPMEVEMPPSRKRLRFEESQPMMVDDVPSNEHGKLKTMKLTDLDLVPQVPAEAAAQLRQPL
ncbi:hypothetical protein M569_14696 [Genlisea aurea]|uniref:CCHC-type domain-containing protein n=1 Tax=Genlisea aurea TaxID=192259 RepID=S8DBJ2_9LAMI|nr:hypothetical protein M569_14696 [Genlisea aurea]